MKFNILILTVSLIFFTSGCKFSKSVYNQASDAIGDVNVFPYTEDVELGKQVSNEIKNDPNTYPILKKQGNEKVYSYIEGLKNTILNSGKIKYKSEFVWDITIIDDDKTLNAFATPGGYIYLYTGLIKFLDSEDELLGVLGHEMAHADQRHSTRQLTKTLGLSILLDAVLGKRDAVEQILGTLATLKFSRSHETEADEYSVSYLCGTSYNAAGAAGFFEKMEGQPTPPVFISTHPNPSNRVENIHQKATDLGCSGTKTNTSKYAEIKSLL